MRDDFTLIINSCNAYSDLWDAHVQLLEENWPDRDVRTIILTDLPTERSYRNIEIVCAGEGKEITDRLRYVIPFIKSPYVFMTLDDYFLWERIESRRIHYLIEQMKHIDVDYLRLFKRPSASKGAGPIYNTYLVDLSVNYAVNLYPGVWKVDFLKSTLVDDLNAWEYEVSLTSTANSVSAICLRTDGEEFPFLDVIRKGKVLHKAAKYLLSRGLYPDGRQLMPLRSEVLLYIRTLVSRYIPKPLRRPVKRFLKLFGKTYYTGLD